MAQQFGHGAARVVRTEHALIASLVVLGLAASIAPGVGAFIAPAREVVFPPPGKIVSVSDRPAYWLDKGIASKNVDGETTLYHFDDGSTVKFVSSENPSGLTKVMVDDVAAGLWFHTDIDASAKQVHFRLIEGPSGSMAAKTGFSVRSMGAGNVPTEVGLFVYDASGNRSLGPIGEPTPAQIEQVKVGYGDFEFFRNSPFLNP